MVISIRARKNIYKRNFSCKNRYRKTQTFIKNVLIQQEQQIYHKQCSLSRGSFIMKIFVILDFQNEIPVWHK